MAKVLSSQPSALSGSYIKTTVGGINYDAPGEAFENLGWILSNMRKRLGELTPLFDNIADPLIIRIQKRFEDNSLNRKPFAEKPGLKRSKFTKLARVNPNGSTLKDTGRLQRSIRRLKSPTKSSSGGQREVSTLRIGTVGVPYASDHLFGGTFEVEGWEMRVKGRNRFYTNFDKMNFPSGKTNASEYSAKQLKTLSALPTAVKEIEIPIRDFLAFDKKTTDFVEQSALEYVNQYIQDIKSRRK